MWPRFRASRPAAQAANAVVELFAELSVSWATYSGLVFQGEKIVEHSLVRARSFPSSDKNVHVASRIRTEG